MINIYYLVDAVPAAFFGIVALWAAGSSLHWFLRTTIVGAILLAALLIPAHELVIQFGVETLFVVMGMWLWRRSSQRAVNSHTAAATPRRPLQLSLRTMLLFTVPVCVTTAVLANTPWHGWYRWGMLIGSGLMAAIVVLACVWFALGKTHWLIRLIAVFLFTVGTSIAMTLLESAGIYLYYSMEHPQFASSYWQQQTVGALTSRSVHWTKVLAIAISIICIWLRFTSAAGWFTPLKLSQGKSEVTPMPRSVVHARWCVVGMFLLLLSLPLYLLYRLVTPTPIPPDSLPTPNGYDELVAAGKMVRDAGVVNVLQWDQLSDAQFRAEVDKHEAALARVQSALNGNFQFPFFDFSRLEEEVALALFDVSLVMHFKLQERGVVSLDEKLILALDMLRLAHAESRACGTSSMIFFDDEDTALIRLWRYRNDMSAAQCIETANVLWDFEIHREPWENLAQRQRIIDENGGWSLHLETLLADWSGTYLNWGEQARYWDRKVKSRLLILELAMRAYQLQTGRLPEELSNLVPKFLLAVPDDPYGSGPLKYRRSEDSYSLYSVGYDQDDDGGQPATYQSGAWDGDLSTAFLFPNSPATALTSNDGTNAGVDDSKQSAAEKENDRSAN
jgi:hypothetical protein